MPLSTRFSRNTFLRSALITAGLLLLDIGVGTIWGGISYERTQREAGKQLCRRLQIAELLRGTVLTHAADAAQMAAADTRPFYGTDHAQLRAALQSREQHGHDDIEIDLVDTTGALASTDALTVPPRAAGAEAGSSCGAMRPFSVRPVDATHAGCCRFTSTPNRRARTSPASPSRR